VNAQWIRHDAKIAKGPQSIALLTRTHSDSLGLTRTHSDSRGFGRGNIAAMSAMSQKELGGTFATLAALRIHCATRRPAPTRYTVALRLECDEIRINLRDQRASP